jgi:hypothetical protein
MPPLALVDHLLNFVAPAFFMALALVLAARWLLRRQAGAPGFWAQLAINFIAGVAVLAIGLMYFGRDGKMATYAGLVAVCGTVQWFVAGGYRR